MNAQLFDVAHMLAGGLVLVSFMLLYQDRMFALLNVFALHAVVLSASQALTLHLAGDDGVLRARPIEVGGGWVPLVPQLHLLKEIALPDDPRSPWSPAGRLSERLHDVVDPLVGWRTAVDGMLKRDARQLQVRMGIDEPGEDDATTEIDQPRPRTPERHDLGIRPDRLNTTLGDRHRAAVPYHPALRPQTGIVQNNRLVLPPREHYRATAVNSGITCFANSSIDRRISR